MGDVRFERPYFAVRDARDRAAAIRSLADEEVVAALVVAREEADPYLANVLASEAMNRLRRSALIVQMASEGLLSQDAEGRLTYMNPAAERMLGWSFAELAGRPIHDIVHYQREDGTPLPAEECLVAAVARTGRPVRDQETVLTRKDGTMFAAQQAAAPILREGDIEGVVVTFSDITERRRAEAAVRQLASIVDASEDAIVMYTAEGTLLTWNRGAQKMYGWTEEEIVGRSVDALAAPEERERFQALRRQAAAGTPIKGAEQRRVRKDGSFLDVSLTISPIRDRAGRVVALSAISRDITARRRAEAALRDSEARKGAMLAASLDAIVTMDEESRVVEWNAAAERIFGWSEEEAVGRELPELIIPPEYREAHRRGLARYLETGEGPVLGRRLEVPALRKDRTSFPAELSIVPLRTPDRRLFTGFLRDITEQKRAEAALRASEERFRALYDLSPNMYLTVDATGSILSINAFGARQLGYAAEEILGRKAWDLFHPDDRERLRRMHEEFFLRPPAPHTAREWEGRKLARDGRILWVREAVTPVLRDDGSLTALVTCFDLTERVRVEAALHASRERVTNILESITDAFFALDREYRFTYLNREADRVARTALREGRSTLLGRVFWEAVPDMAGTPFESAYRRVMEERVAEHFVEYHALFATWFEVHAYPSPEGIAVFFRDVTERKRTEEALEAAREDLERRVRERTEELAAANRELEAFSYLVSHDLKEPLRAMSAYIGALRDDHGAELSPEARELVERSADATRRMERLLRGLLELGRIGRLSATDLHPVELHEALESTDCATRYEHLLRERGATLEVDMPRGVRVRATEPALCQIVGNLVVNAILHNPSASPRVRVQAAPGPDEVEVAVEDNGAGFATGTRTAFAQGAPARGGFGLAIVRRMVERLGGRIELGRSDLGGAAVRFWLPREPDAPRPPGP